MPDKLALLYKETERLCQPDFRTRRKVSNLLEFRLVDSLRKYGRSLPLPFLEIKTFSRLSGNFNMFFQSRVDAAHPRVVRHPVDGQHVGRGPGIN